MLTIWYLQSWFGMYFFSISSLLGLDQCGRTFGGLGLPAIIAVVEEYELILIISIFTTRERKV